MPRERVDAVLITGETYEAEVLVEDLARHSCRTIGIMIGSLPSSASSWYIHMPPDYGLKGRPVRLLKLKNRHLRYLLYPVLLSINMLLIFRFVLCLTAKFRVGTVIVSSPDICASLGILRKLHVFQKLIYMAGDWFAGGRTKSGIYSYLNSNIVQPLIDYLSCRFSDVTLNASRAIARARRDYWGRSIAKNEAVYVPRLAIKSDSVGAKQKAGRILFLGIARPDSGLDIIIRSLPMIRHRIDAGLKIVGERSTEAEKLRTLATASGVGEYVQFLGAVERNDFKRLFSDCFCGVNLVSSKVSHTSRTVPAKVMDYIQYLLPVIASESIGEMAAVIREHRLGLIINPDENSFTEAVIAVYEKRQEYRSNLERYISEHEGTDIATFLD